MENKEMLMMINNIFSSIEKLIPIYMNIEEDKSISNGNLSVCIIDEFGQIYAKMFGTNKSRLRESQKIAWIKASQVWLTGVKTGEYERMVFNKEIDENAHGIETPDLIGWEGGQPLTLKNGKTISVGFSGFRGITDLEIMIKALNMADNLN
nr:hypothetical protein [uncultured Flavobacterium sp.]